jgi:crotonobetainyl-CoA:carnitine CoA-transferase CaiB-like acyl-CoA transferase
LPPLDGIRVLDMAPLGPGPHCSQILADLGAQVIKIEQPEPKEGPRAGRTIRMPADAAIRRDSRSIGLNLKTDEGRAAFHRLAGQCDVVIEGFRPGVVKRLGVDYDAVKESNPKIVYASLSGYGQDGPYSTFVGHDINYQAVTGILAMTGTSDGPPVIPGNTIADNAAGGINAVAGILAALFARERTGVGQYIDSAMVDGLTTMMFLTIDEYLTSGHVSRRGQTLLTGMYPWYNIYETKDGKYLSVGAIEPWFYENLCRALGREDLAEQQYAEGAKRTEVFAAFREAFLSRPRDQWVELLMPAETCVAPVLEIDEVANDPHLRHRGLIMESNGHRRVGAMIKLSETPASVRGPRPTSDDTTAILREFGYDEESVGALRRAGAIT